MSMESASTPLQLPTESFAWHQAWIKAVTNPRVETYQALLRDPKASAGRAYLWIFLVTLIVQAIALTINFAVTGAIGAFAGNNDLANLVGGSVIGVICFVPLFAFASVVGLMITAGLTHLVAKLLGGTGTYSQMAYAMAAYLAPIWVVNGLLSAIGSIPYLGFVLVLCVVLPLAIYTLVLNVIAINAVQGFGWGRSVGTLAILYIGGAIIAACVAGAIVAILAALGQRVTQDFNTIQQMIVTPTP